MAGGVPRRSGGESLLSHGFAVPAPPEGEPRGLRSDHRLLAGFFGMAENVEIFRIFPEKGVAKPWGQWYNTNVSCMKSQREGRAPLFFLNFLPGAGPEKKGCAQ